MTDSIPLSRLLTSRTTTRPRSPVLMRGGAQDVRLVWLGWLLCLTAGLWTSTLTQAADTSASAAAALKVLSIPLPEEMGNAPAPASVKAPSPTATARASITVQKGESIDAVIRRGLPGLPLKEDFMRQALAQTNPSIFPKGQTYPVRPGTVLLLPSHEELRQMIWRQYPNATALFPKPATDGSAADTATGPDKRRWVRYP